jgi:hypothetical protein
MAGCNPRLSAARAKIVAAEFAFNRRPAFGEIAILGGQRPEAVQMIRQKDDGEEIERPALARVSECLAKNASGDRPAKQAPPPISHHGEKSKQPRAPANARSSA